MKVDRPARRLALPRAGPPGRGARPADGRPARQEVSAPEPRSEVGPRRTASRPSRVPPRRPTANGRSGEAASSEADYQVFDEEINSRYEEIKRGSTHISEPLQQMTMAQLLKVARDEDLTDYTGLKKQDLIFKILKERTIPEEYPVLQPQQAEEKAEIVD